MHLKDVDYVMFINNLLDYICVLSYSVVSDSLQPHGLQPARLLCPWDFPHKNTGVSCHFLLQGIFPNQGSNPHLLHLGRWILYPWATWKPILSPTPHSFFRKGYQKALSSITCPNPYIPLLQHSANVPKVMMLLTNPTSSPAMLVGVNPRWAFVDSCFPFS